MRYGLAGMTDVATESINNPYLLIIAKSQRRVTVKKAPKNQQGRTAMSNKVIVKLHNRPNWFEAYIFAGRWHITVDGVMKQVHEECVESWQYLSDGCDVEQKTEPLEQRIKKEADVKIEQYHKEALKDAKACVRLLGDQNPGQVFVDNYLHQRNSGHQMKKGERS